MVREAALRWITRCFAVRSTSATVSFIKPVAAAAAGLMNETVALVDRTAKHRVIHRNAAARTKSRLARALAKLQTAGEK